MVAIKTIRLEGLAAAGASLDELMDRFKREAQVSAQLKHPNIVTIYDIGEVGGDELPGHGVHRRHRPGPRDRQRRAACPLERAAVLGRPGGRRAGLRPPARRRPPRHQAREHHDRGAATG